MRGDNHEEKTQLNTDPNETAIAEEIVSVLRFPALRFRFLADTAISYTVRDPSMKLRSVILDRGSLRRLLVDRDRAVKIEYLRRDLLRSAGLFRIYRYPRRDESVGPGASTTSASPSGSGS